MSSADRPPTPEERARVTIDEMLTEAGWVLHDAADYKTDPTTVLGASRGVVIREFLLDGNEEADYLLFVDQAAVGVIEAKPEGTTLTGVEHQSSNYADGLPESVDAPIRPLPFLYESTGSETFFTNCFDPFPRSRELFSFHRPETLAGWLAEWRENRDSATLRARLRTLPPINTDGLWKAQIGALEALEESMKLDNPRVLIQMATGSGKTFVAANASWRLVRHGGARRILFLVDRSNLGRHAESEFSRFRVPEDGRKFTELYTAQRLTKNRVDPDARVVISTVQRLYSMLKGEDDLDHEVDEQSGEIVLGGSPPEVRYNPALPPEFFDIIIVDECHRSIYGLWSQILSYFDAHIIGLTATPSKQALGFFEQNMPFSYSHEQAVADGVNVNFDVYRIKTEITADGATLDSGTWVELRDRATRRKRWEELEDDIVYSSSDLDHSVVSTDQIRTVIEHYRDVFGSELFPGREVVPKTLIFAKDDSHADDIVRIVRQVFGRGNDFCVKITYKTTGKDPEDLLQEFRVSTMPRIVVTVDMISTGTDVKPLECLIFMRSVKSKNYFEQMKGRGVRVVDDAELQAVSPGAESKTRFVLIDAVGVTEAELGEATPLERRKSVSLAELLDAIAIGNRDAAVVSSVGVRLARLSRRLSRSDRADIARLAEGKDLSEIAGDLIRAVDIDAAYEAAAEAAEGEPTSEQVEQARLEAIDKAVRPLTTSSALRELILEVRPSDEQLIDAVTPDTVIESGFSVDATTRARKTVEDWEAFIEDNKDELSALQILYSKPAGKRITFAEVRELAHAISRPPRSWTPDHIWRAYEALDKSRVRGSGGKVLTDLVSLVRFTLHEGPDLVPWTETVHERFEGWIAAQEQAGQHFNDEQRRWLEQIRDHLAGTLSIDGSALNQGRFAQHGGLGRARSVFGGDTELEELLEELTEVLVA